MIANIIRRRFLSLKNEDEATNLSRFFKTGEGEYGYGDKFLGIKVPMTRRIVKEFKDSAEICDCISIIKEEWHEMRLAGFLLLIELYNKAKRYNDICAADRIVNVYLEHIKDGNNWDLVDLVAPKILGDWLIFHPRERKILDAFADMEGNLWHQRVAIVSTFALICDSSYTDTIRIAERFLTHKHDLIHKATGWMLREMGKRGGYDDLIEFLDKYSTIMPRTMLRYSIERFPNELRQHYMQRK